MATWKLAPALAAGNAVVLKPAEQTPASIMLWLDLVGDLNGALTHYQGPVLPASQAPGVAEVRGELRERVRAAVLRSGNALHLSSWTATVDGREDVYAWRALRAALPPGSPRHVQVSAQLAVLDATLGGFRR